MNPYNTGSSKTGSWKSYLLISMMLIGISYFLSGQNIIDNSNNRSKIKALIEKSVYHADLFELDSSLVYGERVLAFAKETNDTLKVGESYYTLGYAFDVNGKLDDALSNYELARIEFSKIDDDTNVAKAMNGKGVAAFYAGDYGVALDYYLETLKFVEEKEMLVRQADLKQNIANIYRKDSTKYNEALEMYFDSYRIRKQLRDTFKMEDSYYVLGITYMDMKDFDNAKLYFDSSLYFNQFIQDSTEIAKTYNELGHAYFELKNDYISAKKYMELAKAYLRSSNMQSFKFRNLLSIGKVDTAMGNFIAAEDNFLMAYDLVKNTERDDLKLSAFELLRDAQSKSGKYREAYTNSRRYEKLYKEIKSTDREKYIEELQTEYETEQKEKQIELQELRLDQAANQKSIFILFLTLLGLSLLSAIGFLYNKSKTNRMLSVQKDQIQKALKEKDILLREIHHRVKNNLQVISSLLSLQSRYTEDPSIESALQEGKNRVKSMSLIHQNLYQKENLTGIDMQDYFTKLFNSLFSSYNIHNERIQLKLDIPKINLDVETVVPIGLIVNEMVSNSLKHAFPDNQQGVVKVSLLEQNNTIRLTVEDDGVGIAELNDILDGDSFGYTLIDSFKDKLNADLSIESENGTRILMHIKNYKKIA